jgi:hypothetical protein
MRSFSTSEIVLLIFGFLLVICAFILVIKSFLPTEPFVYSNTRITKNNELSTTRHFPAEPTTWNKNSDNSKNWNQIKTMDRMEHLDPSSLPTTAANATPYNSVVANPQTYSYSPYLPRSILKDPQAIQADYFRGDIPITRYDVPVIAGSQYGAGSQKLDGYFTDALNQNYNKLSQNNNFGNQTMNTAAQMNQTVS